MTTQFEFLDIASQARKICFCIVFTLGIFLLSPVSTYAAGFSHVQGKGANSGGTNSYSLTLNSAPTQGNLVVCGAMWYNGGGTAGASIVDSNGNSYTQIPISPNTANSSSAGEDYLFYLLSAPANASNSITVTFASSGADIAFWCDEFSATGGTIAYDTDGTGSGASGATMNAPTVTPATSNELFYTSVTSDNNVTTVNSPWTLGGGELLDGCGVAYDLSVSSATAVNISQGSGQWSSLVAAFKIVPSAPSTGFIILQ